MKEIKLIFKIAVPLMAAFLAQKGMQLIDTIMMGYIGPSALAAGALSTPIIMMFLMLCMGTLSATGIFIARAKGADDFHEINSSLQSGLHLAVLLSIPSMIGIWFAPTVLTAFGINSDVVIKTTLLLHGLLWGIPGFLFFYVLREFLSAYSLSYIVLIVCICALPITFIANYVLIYGKYGFPQLGIAGIGYAGAIIMWFMAIILFLYCLKQSQLQHHINALKFSLFKYETIWKIFLIGIPSGFILILDTSLFSAAGIFMSHFGVSSLAAYQIAMQFVSLAYAAPFALSMATALLVSHAIGAENMQMAKRFIIVGLVIGITIAIFLALLFIFDPQALSRIFSIDKSAQSKQLQFYAISFLSLAAYFQCFDALQTIMNGALKGFKDTFIPMILCVVSYWLIGILGAYYLAFHTRLGSKGIWLGIIAGIVFASITLMLRYLYIVRNTEIELKRSDPPVQIAVN